MIRSKFFNFLVSYNHAAKALMSSSARSDVIEQSIDLKKLEHYRHLNALDTADVKPAGWDEAKPFEQIPGPKPLPLVGNIWRFLFPNGTYYKMDFLELQKVLHEQYGDISILKGMLNRKPMVTLYNVKDIETLYRNEGVWPVRVGLESFQYYRKTRKDLFKNPGVLTHQGEDWFKFRSMVNPIIMQPRNVLQYVDKMNLVAEELINNINYFSGLNKDGEMPEDFQHELYKWSLESIGVVTMDRHLGCLNLDADKNSEPQQLIRNVLEMFQLSYRLDVLPSLWKWYSTKDWKRYCEVLNFITETNFKYVEQYLNKLDSGEVETDSPNVLHKLVKLNRDVAIAMAVDMMIAGVDTTGRMLGATLYYLAKYPEKQQKLREEAKTLLPDKNTPVTKETLAKAPYLKATIKETLRKSPIAIGNLRTTVKDLVLCGYQVPKGTDVFSSNLYLCHLDKNFPQAKGFLPERWLPSTTGELSHKNTNPFLFAPFGYGPRSCIGKRLASMELEVAVLKIVRNFEMHWPHEDMIFTTTTLHGLAGPLKIHVKPISH